MIRPKLLCESCCSFETLILKALASGRDLAYGLPLLDLDITSPFSPSLSCPLCEMFFQISPREDSNSGQALYLFESPRDYEDDFRVGTLFLASLSSFHGNLDRATGRKGFIEIRDRNSTVGSGALAEMINPKCANLQLVQKWMRECNRHHDCVHYCHERSEPSMFSFIDCVTDRVVKKKVRKFAALSYVWGSPARNQPLLSTGSSVLRHAPLVVRDAMLVTRNLGLRYLWVDRYCIDQTNTGEKLRGIRSIDQVFERAEIVICAAAGDDAEYGLPGITPHRRQSPSYRLEQVELRSTLPNIKWAVSTSRWNTRAWTLQEARLARRCLFFTEYQMYFVCRTATKSESLPSNDENKAIELLMNEFALDSALFSDIRDPEDRGHDIFLDRQMYSQRSLTMPEDALHAMQGMLNRSPFMTLWGIPIQPFASLINPSRGMAFGLLWSRDLSPDHSGYGRGSDKRPKRSARRKGFPTWSWASITGAVTSPSAVSWSPLGMFQHNLPGLEDEHIASSLTMAVPNGGELIPLSQALEQASLTNTNCLSQTFNKIWVEGDMFEVDVYLSSVSVTTKRCSYKPSSPKNLNRTTHLRYKLRLNVQFDLDQDTHTLPDRNEHHKAYALILVEDHDSESDTVDIDCLLLDCVSDGHCERKGLLHKHEIPRQLFEALPKQRMSFWLQ